MQGMISGKHFRIRSPDPFFPFHNSLMTPRRTLTGMLVGLYLTFCVSGGNFIWASTIHTISWAPLGNFKSVCTVQSWRTSDNPKQWFIVLSRFEMVFFHKTLLLVNTVALDLHPHSKPLVHMPGFTFTLMTQLLIKVSTLSIQHRLVSKFQHWSLACDIPRI